MLSLESIKRQVDREGAPWGVFGVIKDGKVFAATQGKAISSRGGVGLLEDAPVLLSEINEQSTFPMFLAWRVQRAEWDTMRRFTESERRRQAAMAAAYDDIASEFKRDGRRRLGGVIHFPVRR